MATDDDGKIWNRRSNYPGSGRVYLYLIIGFIFAIYLLTHGNWQMAIFVLCFVITMSFFIRWLMKD